MFLARFKKKKNAPQGSAVASGDLKNVHFVFFESFQMFVNCIVQTHDSKC